MKDYQFSVDYSETIVREAVRRFLWHRLKRMWKLWFGVLLLACATATLFWLGDRSWFVGVMGSSFCFSIMLIWFVYRSHLTNSVGKLRKMRVRRADFELQDEHLTITAESGAVTLPWSAIQEIVERPRFWLLCTAPNQFFTLPTLDVPQEALDFIRSRAQNGVSRGFGSSRAASNS